MLSYLDLKLKDLEDFYLAVEQNYFSQAHEILEIPWKNLKKIDIDKANGLKGLINAATSLHHLSTGKLEAHKKTWDTYQKYLPLLESDTFDKIKSLLIAKKLSLTFDKLS